MSDATRQRDPGAWVIANIYDGSIAPETARYGSMDEAAQVLNQLVQQERLAEGDYEVRPAPVEGEPAPAYRPGHNTGA